MGEIEKDIRQIVEERRKENEIREIENKTEINMQVWQKSHVEEVSNMSKKYTFNSKDLKDVAVMTVVTGLGAAVVFILDNVLPFVDFGQFNGIIVPLIPVVTYSAKKFIQGK